jgi:hypothetical protein
MGYKIRKYKSFTDAGFERRIFFSPFFIKLLPLPGGEISKGIPIYTGTGYYI